MTPARRDRIGLFGGSFDPPHRAHVELARAALDALALDAVLWIPAGDPWQKARAITAAEHRAAMVELAIRDQPRFVLERCELARSGPSYTLDTVRELRARHPHAVFFLVIGADQYARLHTWHGWRELLGEITLAVANRPGPLPVPPEAVRRTPHTAVPLPMLDISATDIRRRIARGEPARSLAPDLVPAAVAGYIDQHALYTGDNRSESL
jgi:nicotinate-nucleotide adenylyltransferase